MGVQYNEREGGLGQGEAGVRAGEAPEARRAARSRTLLTASLCFG